MASQLLAVSRAEYNEWLNSQITKELLKAISGTSTAIMYDWADGRFNDLSAEQRARGQVSALSTIHEDIREANFVEVF